MKVNELIKILSDFNPNADVKININGIEDDITIYGWDYIDSDNSNINNIKEQKLKTNSLSFCIDNAKDNTKNENYEKI